MFVQVHVHVYANSFIGKRIMNIYKWEVRRNVHFHLNQEILVCAGMYHPDFLIRDF